MKSKKIITAFLLLAAGLLCASCAAGAFIPVLTGEAEAVTTLARPRTAAPVPQPDDPDEDESEEEAKEEEEEYDDGGDEEEAPDETKEEETAALTGTEASPAEGSSVTDPASADVPAVDPLPAETAADTSSPAVP